MLKFGKIQLMLQDHLSFSYKSLVVHFIFDFNLKELSSTSIIWHFFMDVKNCTNKTTETRYVIISFYQSQNVSKCAIISFREILLDFFFWSSCLPLRTVLLESKR